MRHLRNAQANFWFSICGYIEAKNGWFRMLNGAADSGFWHKTRARTLKGKGTAR